MKAMCKEEELNLIDQMIQDTQRELQKGNSDRIYLESELIQLLDEREELIFSECKVYVERRVI